MAITLDASTLVFSIPQADLTLVTGTLYDADTNALRQEMMALLASEAYAWLPDPYAHAEEVTVAGVTYARTLITKGGYSYTFTPDAQWTARLIGSNNDFFDVENGILNQNQVQVIPTNSAGLQVVTQGSGLSVEQDQRLIDVEKVLFNTAYNDDETGKHVILDDDDIATFVQGDLFEDDEGTIPYDENSTKINRRNKLLPP